MNSILAPFKQLVERRLWPVAVLLVVALVAVPVVLARDPEPVPPAATATTATADALTEPVVDAIAPGTDQTTVRGRKRNPFTPAIPPHKIKQAASEGSDSGSGSTGGADAGGSGGGSGSGSGGSGGGGGAVTPSPAAPTTPVATPAPTAVPTAPVQSLEVRFGLAGGPQTRRTLLRLTGLPAGVQPGLLYLGVGSDRKSVTFLVDQTATVDGDGTCTPAPGRCERIVMRARDIEFIEVGGKQYQLEILKIHTKKVSATAAAAARRLTAAHGRDLLRDRLDAVGGLRYDAGTGTLKEPGPAVTRGAG